MIRDILLGKFWHWALLVVAATLLWLAGRERLHVIEFNYFVLGVLAGTALTVLLIIAFHTPGERVTRDEIPPSDDKDERPARE